MATRDITDQQVLEAYRDCGERWPYDLLMEQTGECEKVCFRAMERAEKRGYIECGVSIRSGYLTDKGKELLLSNAEVRHGEPDASN